jgi:hypothetical protein
MTVLADSFDATSRLRVNLDAPLPLGHHAAISRALHLRELGGHWTYTVLADHMRLVHGIDRRAGWWQRELRAAGAAPRPHGVPFGSDR